MENLEDLDLFILHFPYDTSYNRHISICPGSIKSSAVFIRTPRAQPRTKPIKQPRNRRHNQCCESENARCPAHTQRLVHLRNEKGKRRRQRIPRQRRCTTRRGSILRTIHIKHIEVAWYIDEYAPEKCRSLRDDRTDPVNRRPGSPTKPEKGDWKNQTPV
jgi:hypothetical protein